MLLSYWSLTIGYLRGQSYEKIEQDTIDCMGVTILSFLIIDRF